MIFDINDISIILMYLQENKEKTVNEIRNAMPYMKPSIKSKCEALIKKLDTVSDKEFSLIG